MKKIVRLTSLAFCLLIIGITAMTAQSASKTVWTESQFPKPGPTCFKLNEIKIIDSLITIYTVPVKFLEDMERFEKDDNLNSRKQFDVVFTGSSSWTKWKSLPEDMAPLPALNRGFGSSKILDLVYFSNSYLYKLQPKLVFVYCENDIPSLKVSQIELLFRYLEQVYHSKLPKTKIIFCGIKKSISRRSHWAKVDEVNFYLKNNLAKRKNCGYLEMNASISDEKGIPKGEYFLADSLHVNAKGYAKWIEVIKPVLANEYHQLNKKTKNK